MLQPVHIPLQRTEPESYCRPCFQTLVWVTHPVEAHMRKGRDGSTERLDWALEFVRVQGDEMITWRSLDEFTVRRPQGISCRLRWKEAKPERIADGYCSSLAHSSRRPRRAARVACARGPLGPPSAEVDPSRVGRTHGTVETDVGLDACSFRSRCEIPSGGGTGALLMFSLRLPSLPLSSPSKPAPRIDSLGATGIC